jgi:hypothetical protein
MFHVVKISEMIKMTILTKDQVPFTSNEVTHKIKTLINFLLQSFDSTFFYYGKNFIKRKILQIGNGVISKSFNHHK